MKVFSGNITLIINKHQHTQSISNARYAHPFSTIRANLTNIYSLHRQATLKKNVSVAFASEHFSARRNLHNTRLLYIANYQRRHNFDVTRVCASSFIRINLKKHIRYSHPQATSNIYQCEICSISFFPEKARFIITRKHQRSQNLDKTIFS